MISARALLEPATARQQKFFYAVLCAVGALLWTIHAQLPLVFPVDDAYITLHNAEAIAAGYDANYGVSGLVGATSPFHVLLTALFALVMPGAAALYIVMWLGAVAYVLGIARLAFVRKASLAEAALLVFVAIVVAEVPHQLMNGLETGWVMAGLVWTLALASDSLSRGRIVAAMCGLLPLLRPELAVMSALVLALQSARRWQAPEGNRTALLAIATDLGIALLVVLPFALALTVAAGSPVPTTVTAKRHFFAEGCMAPAVKRLWVKTNVWAFAGMLGFLSASIALLPITRLGRAGLLFIAVLLYAYYREFPGALAHYEHRYMYPILPFLLFGIASCLHHDKRIVRGAALGIAVLTAITATLAAPAAWRRHMSYVGFTVDELASVAQWTRDHIEPGSRVLVHDAGYIAHATKLEIVDLVGLKTPASAEAHERWTWSTCGRQRGQAINQIALASRADYLVVLKGWDRIFRVAHGLARHHWRVQKVRPVAEVGYEVYKLTSPTSESGPSSP